MKDVKDVKSYTVVPCFKVLSEGQLDTCEGCLGTKCVSMPNNPRKSLDGSKMIITGIFENAPDAIYLSQVEAEELMSTAEWSKPE